LIVLVVVTSLLYSITFHTSLGKSGKGVSGKMVEINDVVLMSVSFLLMAVLGPIALEELYAANVTGWDAAVKTMFQVLLPILWVIGVAIGYIPRGKKE